jgi:hypothetical protein
MTVYQWFGDEWLFTSGLEMNACVKQWFGDDWLILCLPLVWR